MRKCACIYFTSKKGRSPLLLHKTGPQSPITMLEAHINAEKQEKNITKHLVGILEHIYHPLQVDREPLMGPQSLLELLCMEGLHGDAGMREGGRRRRSRALIAGTVVVGDVRRR